LVAADALDVHVQTHTLMGLWLSVAARLMAAVGQCPSESERTEFAWQLDYSELRDSNYGLGGARAVGRRAVDELGDGKR
jgi:hypothetical protein